VSVCGVLAFHWYPRCQITVLFFAGCQYGAVLCFIGMLGVSMRSVGLLMVCWVSVCGVLYFYWYSGWVIVCRVLCFHNHVEFQNAECYLCFSTLSVVKQNVVMLNVTALNKLLPADNLFTYLWQ